MHTIETGRPLNPIQITDRFGADDDKTRSVIVIGGWDQNPERAADFQRALLKRDIASAAFSGFDTIDPLHDEAEARASKQIAAIIKENEFFGTLPPRMLLRAIATLHLAEMVLNDVVANQGVYPSTVLTHCAGANVYLIARLLEQQIFSGSGSALMPGRAILLEPMIAEGRQARAIARENAQQGRLAEEGGSSFIPLISMRHPDAVNLGTRGLAPLKDILDSKGVTLAGKIVQAGADVQVVLGHDDIAAPDTLFEDISGLGLGIPVTSYPEHEGPRYGHGYVFAQPDRAAEYLAQII
jgi:hypothetical protein